MSRPVVAALTLSLLACGGDSTAPKLPAVDFDLVHLTVVGGDGQTDTVTHPLPMPVKVQITQDASASLHMRVVGPGSAQIGSAGTPVQGILINFVVVEDGCGRPFAGSSLTDSLGNASERWTLGKQAGPCHMEARAVDPETGEAVVYDTMSATALPGLAMYFVMNWREFPHSMMAGDSVDTKPLFLWTSDAYGNYTMDANAVPAPQWGWVDAKRLADEQPVPQGTGWKVPAPTSNGSQPESTCAYLYMWEDAARVDFGETCLSS